MSNILNDQKVPSLRTFKKFLHLFLQEEKDDLWILVIYGICISICSLVIPVAVQTFVNTIGFGLLLQPILILTLIVSAVLIFSGTLRALQIYVTEVLQQRLFAKVAIAVALRIPQYIYSSIPKNRSFYEINYFLEVATLQKTATVLILDASSIALQVIFGLLLLAFYHPFLLALNLVILIFIFVFFFGRIQKGIETSIKESKAKYEVAAWLAEVSKNPTGFRSHGGRDFVVAKADQLTLNYVNRRRDHFKILFQQIIAAIVLEILVSSLLLGIGGWLVVRGQLTLGQLVASELIVSVVILGVAKFGKYLESYYDLAAALDKIGHLLEMPVERVHGESQTACEEEVNQTSVLLQVKNLTFEKANRFDLSRPIHFQLNAGEKLALVGSHQAIRTEIIQILYGLNEDYTGAIEVDGADLRYTLLNRFRSRVAYVRKYPLTKGSILDHLRLGNETIPISRIQDVLKNLSLHDALGGLEQGLHTDLSEAEFRLKMSLQMKVPFARALLHQPKITLSECNLHKLLLPKLILVEEVDTHLHEDLLWLAQLEKEKFDFGLIVTSTRGEWTHSFDTVIDLDQLGSEL